MITQTKVLLSSIFLTLLFGIFRYRHYLNERKRENHDEYEIIAKNKGVSKNCANMSMFGFKYSMIMGICTLNLLLILYLIFHIRHL